MYTYNYVVYIYMCVFARVCVLTFYLTFFLAFYLAPILMFFLACYLASILAFHLASILAFIGAFYLPFFLPFFQAFCLTYVLAFYLVSILTFIFSRKKGTYIEYLVFIWYLYSIRHSFWHVFGSGCPHLELAMTWLHPELPITSLGTSSQLFSSRLPL